MYFHSSIWISILEYTGFTWRHTRDDRALHAFSSIFVYREWAAANRYFLPRSTTTTTAAAQRNIESAVIFICFSTNNIEERQLWAEQAICRQQAAGIYHHREEPSCHWSRPSCHRETLAYMPELTCRAESYLTRHREYIEDIAFSKLFFSFY